MFILNNIIVIVVVVVAFLLLFRLKLLFNMRSN